MDDIVYQLRVPLPYNLAGMTTTQLGDERRKAADEIERLRADRDRFEAIAKQAIKTLEGAMAVIEQIQGAVHRD